MIATALQLFTFARGCSAKTWLVVITLVAILAAGVRLVTYGEHREALRVATQARADTVKRDVATLRIAQAKQDTALAHLAAARLAMVAASVTRNQARSVIPSPARKPHPAVIPSAARSLPFAVIPSAARSLPFAVIPSAARNLHLAPLDSLPAAIVTLINADDAKITADSMYIAATDSLTASIELVENAHAILDTTLIHPPAASAPQASGFPGGRYAIAGILGIGARLCFNLVHHRSLMP